MRNLITLISLFCLCDVSAQNFFQSSKLQQYEDSNEANEVIDESYEYEEEVIEEYKEKPFVFFSDAIDKNIALYKANTRYAAEKNDKERVHFLFDSLVDHCLKGTHFDNFLVNKVSGVPVYFEKFEKPIYLKATATWCEPNDSEIAAFNDIAKEFSDSIDFVVLYWNSREQVSQVNHKYSSNVHVLFVDENENFNASIISHLKHALGLPTYILLDQKRNVIDIRRGANPLYKSVERDGLVKYNNYYIEETKEHYIDTYSVYFDKSVIDVNTIISHTNGVEPTMENAPSYEDIDFEELK